MRRVTNPRSQKGTDSNVHAIPYWSRRTVHIKIISSQKKMTAKIKIPLPVNPSFGINIRMLPGAGQVSSMRLPDGADGSSASDVFTIQPLTNRE